MLWKVSWRTDEVLLLLIAVVLSVFTGSVAGELLGRFGVAGFRTPDGAGSILLATLSFHGAAIVAAIVFLKLHAIRWRDALGLRDNNLGLQLLLTFTVLAAALPVMYSLEYVSEILLQKMHWSVDKQRAVEMFSGAKTVWLRVYLGFFAVVLAPLAEEFIFRGLLFSGAKKLGWPKAGWVGASMLFALIHMNAPAFLPLFVFALALTWLYQKTGGLFAPMLAHSLFNALNLLFLLHEQRASHVGP